MSDKATPEVVEAGNFTAELHEHCHQVMVVSLGLLSLARSFRVTGNSEMGQTLTAFANELGELVRTLRLHNEEELKRVLARVQQSAAATLEFALEYGRRVESGEIVLNPPQDAQ